MGNSARTFAILLVLVGGMSGGCSTQHERALVKDQVAKFHALLDAGRGGEIYDGASPDFRNAGTKPEFVDFLDAVHRKLGTVQQASVETWQVNNMTNGKFIALTYTTTFSGGVATEHFAYRLTKGTPILMRYNILSNVLVTK